MITKRLVLLTLAILTFGPLYSQDIKTLNFNELEPKFNISNDTTYVINFWAMWCKPCVEELPEFEHIRKEYQNKKIKVLLISMDFGSNVEKRLVKFLKRKGIDAEVLILDDPDANSWVGKVDKEWDGALPATVVYKKDKKKFFIGKITYSQLAKTIDQINN